MVEIQGNYKFEVARNRDRYIAFKREILFHKTNSAHDNGYHFYSIIDGIAWNPDAAIICSPASMHLNQANKLLSNNIPVLIEKPLLTGEENTEEIDRLFDLAKQLTVEVGYVNRYHPLAEEVKIILDKKELGKVVDAEFYCGSWLKDWRKNINYEQSVSTKKELGGGALLELSHEIDMAYYLFGKIKLKGAILVNTGLLKTDAEDMATLICKDNKDASISIRLNYCSQPSKRHLNIRGELGEIEWDLIEQSLTVIKYDSSKEVKSIKIERNKLFEMQLLHFFESIKMPKEPKCSIAEALQVVKCIQQARSFK